MCKHVQILPRFLCLICFLLHVDCLRVAGLHANSNVCFVQMYRGMLVEAEDNMNCSLSNVTMTGRDGRVSTLEQVFIRGGLIRFLILPDILQNAPMFKRIDPKVGILRGKGVGIGRSTMARAKRGGPERGGPRGGGRGVRG